MKLYHGTNIPFDKFDPKRLNSDCAIDQYGSGFYFFDTAGPTVRYGDIVIVAECEIKSILDVDNSSYELNYYQIEELLLKSPDLDYCLGNFGDTNFESFDHVLSRASENYTGGEILRTLNSIGNDFFKGDSAYVLLRAFSKMTGFNCIRKELSGGNIYVMLDDRDIDIIEVTTLEDMNE